MADRLREEEQHNPGMGTAVEVQQNLPAMLDASGNDHGDHGDPEDSPSLHEQNVELSPSQDLDEIVETFPNSRRLENVLVLWTNSESVTRGRLNPLVVRYTCCLVLQNDYLLEGLEVRRSEAVDTLCLEAKRLRDAIPGDVTALYYPTQKIGDPNTFAATYLQLIATEWFWGNTESMWKHQSHLSRLILSKGGLGELGIDRKLGRMVVSTFMAIALVEDYRPELVLESKGLEDVRDPTLYLLAPSEHHDTMIDQATPQLYNDVLALIRKVQQPGHARNIIDEVWAMERRVLDEIEAEKKNGNILRVTRSMQLRPWPDYMTSHSSLRSLIAHP
ncbi:hypothetical protein V8F06_007487 [Rhypophila decipiens]